MESALNTNCNVLIIKDNRNSTCPESQLKNSFNRAILTELKSGTTSS